MATSKSFLFLAGFLIVASFFFFLLGSYLTRPPQGRSVQRQVLPASEGLITKGLGPLEETEAVDSLSEEEAVREAPKEVRALYFTCWSASKKGFADKVIKFASTTQVNAVVIDLKDFQGWVAYQSKLAKVESLGTRWVIIKEIEQLIKKLHEHDIYLIARISVFQDPVLAKARPDLGLWSKENLPESFEEKMPDPSWLWADNWGLNWLDPASPEVREYNIDIAQEALELGFDEINFDYIRFPSDGDLKDIHYPIWSTSTAKHLVIREFFSSLRERLPDTRLSVDLFAFSLVRKTGLGVGQLLEDSFLYFDYICPMVYPSHYSYGFLGYENPADFPYEVVKRTMEEGVERLKAFKEKMSSATSTLPATSSFAQGGPREITGSFRPWLQDFDLAATYDTEKVKAEIRAVKDVLGEEFKGFILWNAFNIYTKEALVEEVPQE